MAGLFGLFGKKADSNSQETTGDGFYMEGDVAKGLGEMDRFKNMPPVKKTFPVEVEVPTLTTLNGLSGTTSNNVTEESATKTERRRADSSMDMFRNLAREIKKP
ncbi:hypothetical protein PCC9214_00490 [Planktothrix tepida]|uniref:Uncharacterized protein n=2 Tax=Planktothrix TaxID=54304 RepID=A0A1J1LDV5_9CYAN|nr:MULTISPECIES: hypothetical protein [Planktothrix]CAD5918328.1 hypothetical protein PCC9214_00490 [Planktothrix tepida]CAD5984761.1 hypothetical protein NO713_05312 [Planktothrix pseudagardhii]CUR30779.1 conserved hypothetical protein [Planktothrix tepida PCC 9214]